MKYVIQSKETGIFIDSFNTYEEAKEMLNAYERSDKNDGIYEENFYEIVEEED